MGVVKLAFFIFKQMIDWWQKVLLMSDDRYPKLCYEELRNLDQKSSNITKYNWVTLLKTKFLQLGYAEVWNSQNSEWLKAKKADILKSYHTKLVIDDWESLENSSFSLFYRFLLPYPRNIENFTAYYLVEKNRLQKTE